VKRVVSIEAALPLVEELSPAPDVGAALAAFSQCPGVALFESSLCRDELGRYSFLTANPFDALRIDRVACGDEPLARLRAISRTFRAARIPDLPPFQGGIAGVLSYELGHAWEEWPFARHDDFHFPALAAGIYDWVLAWDHRRERAWIVSHGFPATEANARQTRAAERIHWVRQQLSSAVGRPSKAVPANDGLGRSWYHTQAVVRAPQFPVFDGFPLTSDFSRNGYLRAVERVIEYIHAGDIFQANLSQRLLFPQRVSPLQLYERLRQVNRATFAGCFAMDDWAVVSASPERFLRADGIEVETRPIKGTRKRHRGPEADLFTRDELRQSEKDQAENVMIVDLLRNDLSRVCAPGSIRVPQLCAVESYETVQHLVSEIRGKLEPPHDAWDLFAAAFPGGSITGAPKVRAMEIISELEPTARGPYCGSLFYRGFDGSIDSSILIRTFLCRNGWIQCPVGGGIVAQSDPVAEYEETLHKAEGMLRALR
jgi:para-aminobenzoate synthetase component I